MDRVTVPVIECRVGLHVIHTVGSLREDHGGTSRSVPALCESLVDRVLDVALITRSGGGRPVRRPGPGVEFRETQARSHGALSQSLAFRSELKRICDRDPASCLVHDHGLWLGSNHVVAAYCRRKRICRVVSPRGMLTPWSLAHGRFRKQVAMRLYQWRDLKTAQALHATSEMEARELRELGLSQPIAVIPNGVTIPPLPQQLKRPQKRMLFLSRIHPKKGLLNLIQAWHASGIASDWTLDIAGPDEGGHEQEVRDAVNRLGLQHSIRFPGAVRDDDKWNAYFQASVFVLPSFSENFGIVVAEALASGIPVLTSTMTPWEEVNERKCGWCVSPEIDSLTATLREIAKTPEEDLLRMGAVGRDFVSGSFSWASIGSQMADFYSWLQAGGKAPHFVIEAD